MNILMLGRWLPPPRRPVRATREYQFARQLARAHRLTVAFITDNPDAAGSISALRSEFGDLEFAAVPRGWKSLASAVSLAAGESCTLSYFRSEALRTRLADRLRRTRYDLIFVSSSSMIQYALDADPSIPLVVDFGEVDSEWWSRQATRGSFGSRRFFRTEATRLRTAETAAARRAVHCVAESPEAAEIVRSLGPAGATTVVPNGVDPDAFGSTPRSGRLPTVVFNTALESDGKLDEAIEFCQTIMPVVRARVAQARFVIASKAPIANTRAGKGLRGLELAAPANDLRSLFHNYAVATAPLREGFDVRTSVLEPMAAGVPVVTASRIGDQLGACAGRDVRVSETALDFAQQVIELLESTSLREEMAAHGRRFVQAHFSWEIFSARLEQLLTGIVNGSAVPHPGTEPRPIPATLGG